MDTPDGCVAAPADGAGPVVRNALTEADVMAVVAEIAQAMNAQLRELAASEREAAA